MRQILLQYLFPYLHNGPLVSSIMLGYTMFGVRWLTNQVAFEIGRFYDTLQIALAVVREGTAHHRYQLTDLICFRIAGDQIGGGTVAIEVLRRSSCGVRIGGWIHSLRRMINKGILVLGMPLRSVAIDGKAVQVGNTGPWWGRLVTDTIPFDESFTVFSRRTQDLLSTLLHILFVGGFTRLIGIRIPILRTHRALTW